MTVSLCRAGLVLMSHRFQLNMSGLFEALKTAGSDEDTHVL